jgi:large subunit ribosomal protein L3
MTSAIADDGSVAAVTLLSAPANVVTQIKNAETDGYQAVQLGFEESKKLSKSVLGHLKPAKTYAKVMCEIRVDELPEELKVGEKISADLFSEGDIVSATGTSKGKGFAGTIKRHNFHRGRKTHGGRSYRRPGSIGSMYPQKIFKGKRMAGQMGAEKVTVKNLKIALVDNEHSVIGVFGAVPGPRKSLVILKGANNA